VRYAPDHLQVAVAAKQEGDVVDALGSAGEILVGWHTALSAAKFVIGWPASLPTCGFAHVSSGITAPTFMTRIAVAHADASSLARMHPSMIALVDHERFPAHAAGLRRRVR
jgi:histidinol dehydrogenase